MTQTPTSSDTLSEVAPGMLSVVRDAYPHSSDTLSGVCSGVLRNARVRSDTLSEVQKCFK